MRIVDSPEIPKSNGHYSQCIEHNGLLYLSGQLPQDPVDKSIPDSVEAQVDLALRNVERILRAAGSAKDRVLQVRLYIPDIAYWDTINARYSAFFGDHKPARSVIPTRDLHFGCLVEIEVIAAVGQ